MDLNDVSLNLTQAENLLLRCRNEALECGLVEVVFEDEDAKEGGEEDAGSGEE
tara:strand:+ start:3523 stop:3681 length:159 start_codon:yes stop_codon:yes gene_type:complete